MNKQEAMKRLQEMDQNTLEKRVQRMLELEQIQTSALLFWSQREWDYTDEATMCFICGHYRSAIFGYTCSVDQILRYEYLKIPGNKYEDMEKKNVTFGGMIKKCQNIPSIRPYIDKLWMLNEIRNKVSVHPLFVDLPTSYYSKKELGNQLILKDISVLLDLVGKVDHRLRNQLDDTEFEDAQGKLYILSNIVGGYEAVPSDIIICYFGIEEKVLKCLASTSRNILKEICEGLYPVKKGI